MNVSHQHKIVFLAVPRTGSRITYKTLQVVLGLKGGAPHGGMTHEMRTPIGCESYLHVAAGRSPFTRWVSCWVWCKTWPVVPGSHYEDFARWLRDNPNDFPGFVERAIQRNYIRTVSAYLAQVKGNLKWHLLRYETLSADFGQLLDQISVSPVSVPIEHNPETLRWHTYYDERSIALVVGHSKMDFERYNYSTDIEAQGVII